MSDPTKSRWGARAAAVRRAETDKFTELITLSGLRPDLDLVCQDWSGVDFSNCDLNGFNMTGSYLHGCEFNGASIAGAVFDGAELGRVIYDPERDPHLPAITTSIANLRQANDWAEPMMGNGNQRALLDPDRDGYLRPGSIFQDAPFAPEMVVVPSGSYLQGDERLPEDGVNRRRVTIAHRLAVGRFPVTFEEWDVCYDDGGTKHKPNDEKWGRVRRPVMSLSWDDITKDYLPWLNRRLGLSGAHAYRLLSEAEWEYACRAGTATAYSFGGRITTQHAQFSEGQVGSSKQTVEVGSFPSNAWGLHDMHGNVWEWCEDAWHDTYQGAPAEGQARTSSNKTASRVLRGGSWLNLPGHLRAANRYGLHPDIRYFDVGFRLARTLHPTP